MSLRDARKTSIVCVAGIDDDESNGAKTMVITQLQSKLSKEQSKLNATEVRLGNIAREREIFLRAALQLLDQRELHVDDGKKLKSFFKRHHNQDSKRSLDIDASFMDIIRFGTLRKANRHYKGFVSVEKWKKKFVELRHGLFSYENQNISWIRGVQRKVIVLSSDNCRCRAFRMEGPNGDNAFELSVINGPRRLWLADSVDERDEWVKAINTALIGSAGDIGCVYTSPSRSPTSNTARPSYGRMSSVSAVLGSLTAFYTRGVAVPTDGDRTSGNNSSEGEIGVTGDANVGISYEGGGAMYAKDISRYSSIQAAIQKASSSSQCYETVLKIAEIIRNNELIVPISFVRKHCHSKNFMLSALDTLTAKTVQSVSSSQVWKDLQRDNFLINGVLVSGETEGPEAMIGFLIRTILDKAEEIKGISKAYYDAIVKEKKSTERKKKKERVNSEGVATTGESCGSGEQSSPEAFQNSVKEVGVAMSNAISDAPLSSTSHANGIVLQNDCIMLDQSFGIASADFINGPVLTNDDASVCSNSSESTRISNTSRFDFRKSVKWMNRVKSNKRKRRNKKTKLPSTPEDASQPLQVNFPKFMRDFVDSMQNSARSLSTGIHSTPDAINLDSDEEVESKENCDNNAVASLEPVREPEPVEPASKTSGKPSRFKIKSLRKSMNNVVNTVMNHVENATKKRSSRKNDSKPSPLKKDFESESYLNCFEITEGQILACVRDMLVLCNRTQCGGDTYFCIDTLICNHDFSVLTPVSTENSMPLEISIDIVEGHIKGKNGRPKRHTITGDDATPAREQPVNPAEDIVNSASMDEVCVGIAIDDANSVDVDANEADLLETSVTRDEPPLSIGNVRSASGLKASRLQFLDVFPSIYRPRGHYAESSMAGTMGVRSVYGESCSSGGTSHADHVSTCSADDSVILSTCAGSGFGAVENHVGDGESVVSGNSRSQSPRLSRELPGLSLIRSNLPRNHRPAPIHILPSENVRNSINSNISASDAHSLIDYQPSISTEGVEKADIESVASDDIIRASIERPSESSQPRRLDPVDENSASFEPKTVDFSQSAQGSSKSTFHISEASGSYYSSIPDGYKSPNGTYYDSPASLIGNYSGGTMCIRVTVKARSQYRMCTIDPQGDGSDTWILVNGEFEQSFFIKSNCNGRPAVSDRIVKLTVA